MPQFFQRAFLGFPVVRFCDDLLDNRVRRRVQELDIVV